MPQKIEKPWERKAKRVTLRSGRVSARKAFEDMDDVMRYEVAERTGAKERRKLDTFLKQYVIDFVASSAAVRMGLPKTAGFAMLWHPYTQRKLPEYVRKLEEKTIVQRNDVISRLWEEANNADKPQDRIRALSELAKILGMHVTKVEHSGSVDGGVMLVPDSGDPKTWEKSAARIQEELMRRAREVAVGRN